MLLPDGPEEIVFIYQLAPASIRKILPSIPHDDSTDSALNANRQIYQTNQIYLLTLRNIQLRRYSQSCFLWKGNTNKFV